MRKIICGLALLFLIGCVTEARRSGYSNDGREQYVTSNCLLEGYSWCLKQAGEICKTKGFDELYIERSSSSGEPSRLTFACGR